MDWMPRRSQVEEQLNLHTLQYRRLDQNRPTTDQEPPRPSQIDLPPVPPTSSAPAPAPSSREYLPPPSGPPLSYKAILTKGKASSTPSAPHLQPSAPPPTLSEDVICRLRRAFPSKITLPSVLIAEGSHPFEHSLVGKFLGRPLPSDRVQQALQTKWVLTQDWEILPKSHGFLIFRFDCQTDKERVLDNGPWIVDDATLCLESWSPSFRPTPTRLPCTILWIRLPDMLEVCLLHRALELIVAPAGRLVCLDESTFLLSKCRYARVAVEVDVGRPLAPENGYRTRGLGVAPLLAAL